MSTNRGPRYGTPPLPRLIACDIDGKGGLVTVVVRTPFVERPDNPLAINFGPIPRVGNLGIVHVGLRAKTGGPGFEVEWTFEGGGGDDSDPEDPANGGDGGDGETSVPNVGLESVYREFLPANVDRSILANPNWMDLQKKYGGDEEGNFPPDMPGGSTGVGSTAGTNGVQPNPMHGVKTYRSAYGIFQVTTFSTVPKASVLQGVNRIVANPPGLAKIGLVTPKGQNWMKLSPRVGARGSAIQFVEQWELSGPGGHNPDVYKGKGDLG